MPWPITYDEESGFLYGRFLRGSMDMEDAVFTVLQLVQLCEHEGWVGNQYWWLRGPVPKWLEAHRSIPEETWAGIQAALSLGEDGPRVAFGEIIRSERADLGILVARYSDGTDVEIGANPNFVWLLEDLCDATDWRFTRQGRDGRIAAFALLDDEGRACGLVAAAGLDEEARARAIGLADQRSAA